MYIFQYLRHVLKLLPFQGATVPTRDTQGVASLALGWVLHWAFSPHFLNPKLESILYVLNGRKVAICVPIKNKIPALVRCSNRKRGGFCYCKYTNNHWKYISL